jgi:hypothetical protein
MPIKKNHPKITHNIMPLEITYSAKCDLCNEQGFRTKKAEQPPDWIKLSIHDVDTRCDSFDLFICPHCVQAIRKQFSPIKP